MRRVLVRQDDGAWQLLGEDDSGLEVAAPKVPLPKSQVPLLELEVPLFVPQVPLPEPPVALPESPHEIEGVMRQEIKATAEVPISLSPSSSIVPAVPAGQTLPATSLPCLMVAAQQPSGLLQQPSPSGLSLLSTSGRGIFDSMMDREAPLTVFDRMLAGATAPFVGTPDLRSGTMDTSTNPAWPLFGWDHAQATFSSVYEVSENPNHGGHEFYNLNHNPVPQSAAQC